MIYEEKTHILGGRGGKTGIKGTILLHFGTKKSYLKKMGVGHKCPFLDKYTPLSAISQEHEEVDCQAEKEHENGQLHIHRHRTVLLLNMPGRSRALTL